MKVLIADDELDIRETLAEAFQAKGFEVVVAADGKIALEKAGQERPDLAVLDVMMPKLSGWEVCKELKKNEPTKNIPVIILTAAKTKEIDELMSAESGADLHLKKPYNPLDIVTSAENLLKEKT